MKAEVEKPCVKCGSNVFPKTHLRPWKVEKQSVTSVLWRQKARYSRLEDALKAVERADLIRGTAMRVVDLDRDLVITVRHG